MTSNDTNMPSEKPSHSSTFLPRSSPTIEGVSDVHIRKDVNMEEEERIDAQPRSNSTSSRTLSPPQAAIIDWDGPDDPENPMNWSMWKKVYVASVPGLICLIM
jgi:hypothetical protein